LSIGGKIELYLKNINDDLEFFKKDDQLYFNACLILLIQIGEQSNKIDETIKNESAIVPWTMIKGFRNIAVHEYQIVDADKVYAICSQDVPMLQTNLEKFIRDAIQKNILSSLELSLSIGSEFYTHVRFDRLSGQ